MDIIVIGFITGFILRGLWTYYNSCSDGPTAAEWNNKIQKQLKQKHLESECKEAGCDGNNCLVDFPFCKYGSDEK